MKKMSATRVLKTNATPIALLILTCVIAVALPLTINPQTVGPSVLPGQSVTILPDGKWLLLGGRSAGEALSNGWVWDPATGRITTLSSKLKRSRAWHTATMLPDGTVLIFGGVGTDQEIVQRAELYNPDKQDFSALELNGVQPRARHTATLLPDGRVLIAGGIAADAEPLATADLWDSSIGSVSQLSMLRARHSHSAVLTPDGQVLIWGGVDANGVAVDDGESYKSLTSQFIAVGSYPSSVFALPMDAPALAASLPIDGSADVPTDAVISLLFSKPLKVETVTAASVTLTGPKGIERIKVVAAENGLLAFVTPEAHLIAGSRYTLIINGGSDKDGLLLPTSAITFTTLVASNSAPLSGLTTLSPQTTGQSDRDLSTAKVVPASSDDDLEWKGKLKDGKPHSDWQDLPALQAPAGVTALSGQALDLKGNPLVDVTLTVEYGSDEVSGRTDASGRFLLQNISPGWSELVIDGRRAHNPQSKVQNPKWGYGLFEYGLEIKSRQTNVLSFTIWLTRIDDENAVKIASPTRSEVVVTTSKVAGLELRIPADTTIRDHEGKTVHEVTLTRIPVDRTPFPLAKNVDVPVYFTAQPGGAYLYGSAGASVVYPNYVNEKPGGRFNFWRYTTEPSGWYIYGHGTVSTDGKQVIPDQGTRIYEFSGAMFETGLSPAGTGPCIGSGACKKGADPVDLGTGLFVLEKTDLYLPDVIPLNLTRIYRQSDSNTRAFGIGMMHTYSIFAFSANQYQEADLVLPDSGRVHFIRTSPGNGFLDAVFEHHGPDAACPTCVGTPTSFYGSRMVYNGNGWDLTLKDGTVYVFGENQPLQAIRDRYGNQVTITRTNGQAGNIVRVTSPNGRWIEFTYDTNSPVNRVIQAKDNMGRSVGYEYDFDGRLFRVTDTGGGTTEYTYDASHRMLTIKDARGIVYLTNEYEPATGRVTKQTQIDGGIYQFAYTTDGNGKVTRTDVTDPRGNIRRLDFNPSAYSSSETLALGKPEEQVMTSEIQPGSNLLLSQIDALGRKTTFTYDAKGNVQTITRLADTPDAVTASYTYEPTYNQAATVTDPLNHTTTFGRDNRGNLASITNALNQSTTFTYNAAGQPISTTDALNHTTEFTYTFADLTTITDPLGNLTSKFTDQAGRVLNVVNPLGQQSGQEYDNLDRLRKTTDALNNQTQFGYDPNGNLLNVTDARTNATAYTYDNMDRIATRQDPLLRTESYQYDLNGNLIQFTDRKNQVSLYAYDALNRRSSVTYTGGSTTAYTYDKGNRVTEVNDSIAGLITRTYDGLDRLKSETTPQGSVAYTYDAAGRRATMTVSGQAPVVYSYDNANRLTQITQGSSTVVYGYDAAGRRTSLTLPNGVLVEYGYDAASRLTGITYKQNGNTVLGDLTYEYDKNGNRTNVGGSFARSGIPQSISAASYNAANQQTAFGDKALTYDNNGNLQTMTDSTGLTTYTWNSRNQLVGISGPGVNATFVYDGLGRRQKKIINGNLTEFLFDGTNPVQESSGVPVSANILTGLGIDEFLARTDTSSGATSTFLTDTLGSSLALTDSAGTLQTEYTYDPFGRVVTTGAPNGSSYQYTGRENDSIGLDYYRARYYDPELHRFISEDPIGFEGGDVNLYAYVSNNPTNYIDPDGNFVQIPAVILSNCASGAVGDLIGYLWTKGRKATLGESLASLAAGCVSGVVGGWIFGIALEAVFPKIMLLKGAVQLWDGASMEMARAEAARFGRALVNDTFTASTINLAQRLGIISSERAYTMVQSFSGKFVSGASSAGVLFGPTAAATKTFGKYELPVLKDIGANIAVKYIRP